MPLAVWKDAYLTGDAVIDRQHQDLFAAINGLHEAICAGQPRDRLVGQLEHLAGSLDAHIQGEERLMVARDYPGFAAHKARHDELERSAAKVVDDFRSGRTVLTIALSRFLADWIRHHVSGDDQAMIGYLQAQAVSADQPADALS